MLSVPTKDELSEDLRATLAQRDERIKELEQTLASSQTASQHYYGKLIANKEAAEQRIKELEAQVAASKREGADCKIHIKELDLYVDSLRRQLSQQRAFHRHQMAEVRREHSAALRVEVGADGTKK